MPIINKTLAMTAGRGYLVKLRPPGQSADAGYTGFCSRLALTAKAECYVQLVDWDGVATAPIAPAADPTPAGNAEADYVHMLADETLEVGNMGQSAIRYTHARVWSIAAGDLVVVGE